MLIDAHCHINSLNKSTLNDVLVSASDNYIFLDSSINVDSARLSLEINSKYPSVYSAIGFHPFSVKEFSDITIETYKKMLRENKKILAIGEIGLDETAQVPHDEQEKILKRFFWLAKDAGLPVLIHNRLKEPKIFAMLDDFFASYEKVIFHCFSYDYEMLQRITDKGGFVSFSLNILRKKKAIIDSFMRCPLENLLLETDSPYMKINDRPSTPLDIKEVYSLAASVRKIPAKDLEEAVLANFKKAFCLDGYRRIVTDSNG
ncbi:MAG: TatD family hydrolase [Candidatus Omnitrophota bacterium]|jgi:TatD DNase family protein